MEIDGVGLTTAENFKLGLKTTGNARTPIDERRVEGMSNSRVSAERIRRRWYTCPVTHWSMLLSDGNLPCTYRHIRLYD